jgi:hypothetical protein
VGNSTLPPISIASLLFMFVFFYSGVLGCAVLDCAVLHCTALHCTVLC